MPTMRRWIPLLALLALLAGYVPVWAEAPAVAGLVVQDASGQVASYCIALDSAQITGYDLLLRTGARVESSVSPQGIAVCQIGETGCLANDCFCQCKGASCSYWAYAHLRDGAWQTSSVGASGYRVGAGEVHGWRWGDGQPPEVLTLDEICAQSPAAPNPSTSGTQESTANGKGSGLAALAPVAIALAAVGLAVALTRERRDQRG